MSQILGAASTRWADYQGTAAADDADALANSRSIYELAGLDRDGWTIVAVDLFMHNNPQVALYATAQGAAGLDADGPVPVTRFRITEAAKVEAFLEQAFKTVAVRLVSGLVAGQDLEVTETVALD